MYIDIMPFSDRILEIFKTKTGGISYLLRHKNNPFVDWKEEELFRTMFLYVGVVMYGIVSLLMPKKIKIWVRDWREPYAKYFSDGFEKHGDKIYYWKKDGKYKEGDIVKLNGKNHRVHDLINGSILDTGIFHLNQKT